MNTNPYSEVCQTPQMKLFAIIFSKSSILDVQQVLNTTSGKYIIKVNN